MSPLLLFCFLLKIFHRHISPHIAAKINENGVDSFHAIEVGGQVVVMLNLSGMLLANES
jgi:hypothetical protein